MIAQLAVISLLSWTSASPQGTAAEPRNVLADVKSVTFRASVWHGRLKPDHTEEMRKGWTLAVSAKRPGCLRIEAIAGKPPADVAALREEAVPFDLLVSDGKRQFEAARSVHLYRVSPSAAKLEDILTDGQDSSTKATVTWAVHNDILFAKDRRGFKRSTSGAGSDPGEDVFEYEQDIAPGIVGKEKWVLFVNRSTGLPRRVSLLMSHQNRPWKEILRTDYSDWKLNVALPATAFDTTPPKGMRQEAGDSVRRPAQPR